MKRGAGFKSLGGELMVKVSTVTAQEGRNITDSLETLANKGEQIRPDGQIPWRTRHNEIRGGRRGCFGNG